MLRKSLHLVVGVSLCLAAVAEAQRDQIRIVGSSTVYPFATKVAEQFGRTSRFKTPVIESTGSGGGLKLFCAGVGVEHPDIANSSRAIKGSEVEDCQANGVTAITEVKIGYDGIVFSNSTRSPQLSVTLAQLWLALAKQVPSGEGQLQENPYERWSEIDPSLPDVAIEVLGPPPTSGTRDAFVELAMEGGCKAIDWIKALKSSDGDRYKAICHGIREDGAFVEAGENDNLIVQKLDANPSAFGIFGFSFLDQNMDRLQGSLIDGVEPTFENIADGSYPVSRPLFFYVKGAHAPVIPGVKEYVGEFTSERAWGPGGYLSDAGLIPMPDEERQRLGEEARSLAHNVE
jgi:phosphate transport system substrate-binding protein